MSHLESALLNINCGHKNFTTRETSWWNVLILKQISHTEFGDINQVQWNIVQLFTLEIQTTHYRKSHSLVPDSDVWIGGWPSRGTLLCKDRKKRKKRKHGHRELTTHGIHDCSNGLENQPLWINLQCVLVSSLDAVEHVVLSAVHGGVLKTQNQPILDQFTLSLSSPNTLYYRVFFFFLREILFTHIIYIKRIWFR